MEYNLPQRFEESNKATYGRVLNIAGSDYMCGAAYLSSVSALKIGCGYCFLCSCDRVIDSVAAKTSNVVFMPIRDLKSKIKTFDVIEIGCGLGQDNYGRNLFNKFLKYSDSKIPVVIDADGLNLISKNPKLFVNKHFEKVVLTPHPKEAARLLGVDNILDDVELAAKSISEKYNCITVLKTHRTFVYSQDGRSYTNTTGNNSMAKAGSGDVLTGIISGLIAQRTDIFEASCLGVYLHGLSGDISKEKLTEYSVMAEDLISNIPLAVNKYIMSKSKH
ncbi:NAD(P)H-hydrate dehydratase [bacterium]|nr:NAD(P)H-hydrate dehydratase [bacterium]